MDIQGGTGVPTPKLLGIDPIISQAKTVETANMDTRPSRRSTNDADGYFRTIQNVQHTLIAHAVTTDATEKALFRKALALGSPGHGHGLDLLSQARSPLR